MRTILLLLAFAASGAGALLYQVTWQRILGLYFGVGSVATALVVAFSLLGLGLGGIFSGVAFRKYDLEGGAKHYVILELLVGVAGILGGILSIWISSFGISFDSGWGIGALLLMTLFAINFGLGITFPMMVSVSSRKAGGRIKLGWLYAVNTIGACVGCVIGPFLVFPLFGLVGGVFLASLCNMLAGVLVIFGRDRQASSEMVESTPEKPVVQDSGKGVFTLSFLSGFLSLGLEMIWFRIVGLIVKPTAYTFGITLGVFLFGLALGGAVYGKFHEKLLRRGNLGILQLLGAVCLLALVPLSILASMEVLDPIRFLYTKSFEEFLHPPLVSGDGSSISMWLQGDVLFIPFVLMMPATVLMGMVFPALIDQYSRRGTELRVSASWIYGTNVVGNFLAVLFVGYIGFELVGTGNMLAAVAVLGSAIFLFAALRSSGPVFTRFGFTALAILCVFLGIVIRPVLNVMHTVGTRGDIYLAPSPTGAGATGVLTEDKEGVVWSAPGELDAEKSGIIDGTHGDAVLVYIGGTRHGILPPHGFIHSRIVGAFGYIPAMTDVFVLGMGSGGYVGSLLESDKVEKVRVAEISSALVVNLEERKTHSKIFEDPRFEMEIGDGRKILARSEKQYDLISVDPLRDTTALSNNLYSKEFFRICYDHLTDTGMVVVRRGRGSVIEQTVADVFPVVVVDGSGIFGLKDANFVFSEETVLENRKHNLPKWAVESARPEVLRDMWEPIERDLNLPINRDFFPVSEYYLFR